MVPHPSAKAGGEVPPPPLSPIWRKAAHYIPALPICRTCCIDHGYHSGQLFPFPTDSYKCQIEGCENRSSFLLINR